MLKHSFHLFLLLCKEDRADLLRRKRENIKKHREAVSDACGKMGGAQLLPLYAEFLRLEDPALPLSHQDLSQ